MGSRPVGSFYVQLGLNTENFRRNLEYAQRDLRAAFGTAAIHASEVLAASIGAVGAALVGLGAKAVKMAADMDKQRIALTRMLGTAEAATAKIKELQQFSAKTGFEFTELVDYQKRLMAVGFTAEETKYMLYQIADATAIIGNDSDKISRLIKAFGDVKAKGNLQTQEIKQFAELGIPAWDMLSKAMGKTRDELTKLVEGRNISAGTALKAITDEIQKRWGGMAEDISKTLSGAFNKLWATVQVQMTELGDWIRKKLPITEFINSITNAIQNIGNALSKYGFEGFIDKLSKKFPILSDVVYTMSVAVSSMLLPALSSVLSFLSMMIVPLLAIYAKTLVIGFAIKDIFNGMATGKSIVLSAFEAIFAQFEIMWTEARRVVADFFYNLYKKWSSMSTTLANWFIDAENSLRKTMWNIYKEGANLIDRMIKKVDEFFIGILDKFLDFHKRMSLMTGVDSFIDRLFGEGTSDSMNPLKKLAEWEKGRLETSRDNAQKRIDERNSSQGIPLLNRVNQKDMESFLKEHLNPVKWANSLTGKIALMLPLPDGTKIPHLINDDPENEIKRLAAKKVEAEKKLETAIGSFDESTTEFTTQIKKEISDIDNAIRRLTELKNKNGEKMPNSPFNDTGFLTGSGRNKELIKTGKMPTQPKEKQLKENFGDIGIEAGNPLVGLTGYGFVYGKALSDEFAKLVKAHEESEKLRKSIFDLRVEIANGFTDAFTTAMTASGNFFHNLGEGFKKLGDQILKQIAQMLIFSTILRVLGINYDISGFTVNPIFKKHDLPVSDHATDGVIQNGKLISTHPDDYIIATKDPSSLGGKANVVVNVNNNSSSEVSTNSYFDGTRTIVDIVIDGLQRNVNGLRDTVRAI